jgi:hypothetical protein
MHAIGPAAPGAAGLAVRWAAEAGLHPDQAAVETALGAKGVFAEEGFYDLLAVLGVPI